MLTEWWMWTDKKYVKHCTCANLLSLHKSLTKYIIISPRFTDEKMKAEQDWSICLRLFSHKRSAIAWIQTIQLLSLSLCVCVRVYVCYNTCKVYHFNHLPVYNSGVLSTFTVLFNHHHYSFPQFLHHPKSKLYTVNKASSFPPPSPIACLYNYYCFILSK